MSRTSLIFRKLRCTLCSHRWKAQFWTRREMPSGKIFSPSYYDLRCPNCDAGPRYFTDDEPRVCATFSQLRSENRPVVYRWINKDGHERFRYPSRNDGPQRANEERIEFHTLREMRTFLKEQNPGWSDWQVPTNDILEYDEAHIDIPALDTSDPGLEEEVADITAVEDSGVTTQEEVEKFLARDDARALIEKA